MIRISINSFRSEPANGQIVVNLHAEHSDDNGATWDKIPGTERNSKASAADIEAGLIGANSSAQKIAALQAMIVARAQQNEAYSYEALTARAERKKGAGRVKDTLDTLIGTEEQPGDLVLPLHAEITEE